MIKAIRTSKFSKIIASYLAVQLVITVVQPSSLFALSSGPTQPEFNSFTPIGTSDMVNLSSGDFNYNIPIMDVGGYPLNLAYDSGVTMDQEASWVGLGWNLNVGQINRQVRGIPDDFQGDEMSYEQNMKPNVTVGISAQVSPQVFGLETEDYVKGGVSVGLGIQYNNYHGISFRPSYGLSFDLGDHITTGINVQTSATEGATISPSLGAKANLGDIKGTSVTGALNAGLTYNSNKGLTSFGLTASVSGKRERKTTDKITGEEKNESYGSSSGTSGRLSFSDITLTPRKRTAFRDFNSTFSFSAGPDLWGFDVETEISATATIQNIKDKVRTERAFGYEFTGQASREDVLDYNRENDRVISKNLLALPSTNYTYDLYSVNGQGIGGQFRPHRSQIGQIYDEFVQDESTSASLGIEAEGGTGWHVGVNAVFAPSESHTGVWDTRASNAFRNENETTAANLDYEPVYFKYVGENKVDDERELYTNQLKGTNAMALKTGGVGFNAFADNAFRVKRYQEGTNIPEYVDESFSGNFKRTKRDLRNQSIQKITAGELSGFYTETYASQRRNPYAKDHHTAEMRMLKPDGSRYVFGETAYNVEKQEVTFATDSNNFDCAEGTVTYIPGENSNSNSSGIDHFYDKVVTPAYAHTYLLSSVLSSDYEDLTGNGPTADDLGAFTTFDYVIPQEDLYQWRLPYGTNQASYNAGLNSNNADEKGSYLYGQKEVKYIQKISTKTHVAIFDISPRKDGRGVIGEDGGEPAANQQQLYKLDAIRLYSRPEYERFEDELEDSDPDNDPSILEVSPIKTAHFVYDYDLCKNVDNNLGGNLDENELTNNLGKLTLKQVYFTYRESQMGKHTPYSFNYDGFNPDYSLKAFDIWGNYKPNSNGNCNTQDDLTTSEYPFVQQDDKVTQDMYASAWALTSIGLPSGGSINLTYESDDYQYVQNKHTMGMLKVVGAGTNHNPSDPENNQLLYKGTIGEASHLYIKLPETIGESFTKENFIDKYLKDIANKPIYFRFLMNMTKRGALNPNSNDFDYVTGYFDIKKNGDGTPNVDIINNANGIYASIEMESSDLEGGVSGTSQVNPISKAGWYFGRRYLNGIVYGLNQDYRSENVGSIARKLVSSIGAIGEIFTGPNAKLRSNAHLNSQRFIPEKSWIRLSTPKTHKLGGGSRIKQLVMNDHWDEMSPGSALQTYGQTYEYTLENNTSSGVATFEPNNSAENPFVEPFYDNSERLTAPREVSYVEKPFGKAFFPNATVTYSRVAVKNLEREDITRHATGEVISEYYTSKDFPTQVDFTDIENEYNSNQSNVLQQLVGGLFGLPVRVKNAFTLSQGYVVHTNDMNAKMKSQRVYQEGVDTPISSVEYVYSTKEGDKGTLSNILPVISRDGSVSNTKEIAVDYDVITDFRESYSKSETIGINFNIAALLFGIFPVIIPTAFPVNSRIENVAHSAITTKVVHTTAILKEKIATDLGSKVSTVNEAWDAQTGEVILTRTINEFDDQYYNFNFPAYWAYSNMGQASQNLGMQGTLQPSGDYFTLANGSAINYLTLGDELMTDFGQGPERLWVVEFDEAGTGVVLMDRNGNVVNRGDISIQQDLNFKIVRSGYRNQQMGNMGAVTMMSNPIIGSNGNYVTNINTSTFLQDASVTLENNLRIVNASAVAYDDLWNAQCENGLRSIPYENTSSDQLADLAIEDYNFNPYVTNVRGVWRAEKSYAYLTERTDIKQGTNTKNNTRKEGYFKDFTPFYAQNTNEWEQNPDAINQLGENGQGPWTFASEVTQYSPYGAELENRDALNRYSSAQYGYNFTLPVAVASNSKYRDMGSDNFEDYNYINTSDGHFSYKDIVEGDGELGIQTSNQFAHSGNTSLLVPAGNEAILPKELIGELPPDLDADDDGWNDDVDVCPFTFNPNQEDYDGDGIGDVCDDDAIPSITNVEFSEPFCLSRPTIRQGIFTIQGKPNSIVNYELIEQQTSDRGWFAFINNGAEILQKKRQRYQIELNGSGRAIVEIGLYANRRASGRRARRNNKDVILDFQLLAPSSRGMQPISDEVVRLSVKGNRKCRNGGAQVFPPNRQ